MDQNEGPPKRQSTYPLFSTFFTTHPQDVVEHVDSMKKQMEDFIEAFKKRADVQMTYSKNMIQVSKSLDKYIKPGTQLTTSFICSAFKVEHQMRSRQAADLAESIKSQIEAMCSQVLKKETTFYKKCEKDVKKYYKQASYIEDDHREALSRFEGINREMEEMIITKNIMKYTSGIPQEKKLKMISKTMESIKENKQYEKLYIQSVKNYNKFTSAYNTEITIQLDQAENFVRDQVVLQADCIRKLIVAEASLFKNIQYDIVNISTQMEGLDSQKDVETFVQKYKQNQNSKILSDDKNEEELKRNSLGESNEYLIEQKRIMGKSMLSNSLLYVDQEYFSWMLFNKKNKKLRDIIAGIWKELNDRSPKQEVKSKEQVATSEKHQDNTDKSEESGQAKVEQSKQNKDSGERPQQIPVPKTDWIKELKQLIQTLKAQNPPSIMHTQSDKKPISLTVQSALAAFMDIMRIISELWNVDEQPEAEQIDQKLLLLEDYVSQHHLYRLVALIFLEEYRKQLEVMIKNDDCARLCSRVLKSIIKQCQKENDTFIIRGILGLIFTYYWADDKYKKLIYLNPEVYQCEIWKRNDFWEAAIFQTTYEEMALFAKQKGETSAQTTLREKNIIFSQLASFCHYMVMLGISSKKVRLIVGRYCRLYEMTQEQNKDLSKMITNTSKQFKQTAFQFSLKAEKEKSVINE